MVAYMCPKVGDMGDVLRLQISEQLETTDTVKNLVDEVKAVYDLPDDWGKGKSLIDQCFNIADLVISDYYNNPNAKYSPSDHNYRQLNKCYSVWLLADFQDEMSLKVTTSYPAGSIINWFDSKISSLKSGGKPFELTYGAFSAHDTNLTPFLYALGLLDVDCLKNQLINNIDDPVNSPCNNTPDLASNMVWELIQDKDEFFVKFSYNNVYIDFCGLKNQDEQFRCQYSVFRDKQAILFFLENFKEVCGIDDDGNPTITINTGSTSGSGDNGDDKNDKQLAIVFGLLALFASGIAMVAIGIAVYMYTALYNAKRQLEELGIEKKENGIDENLIQDN